MAFAVGGHHPDQADGGRLACDTEVLGVLFRRWGDVNHRLALPGPAKGFDGGEAGVVDPHTEVALPLAERSDDPTGRIATIQQHQIVPAEVPQMLEQHLALPDAGGIELKAQGQLRTGQIQQEGDGLADFAAGGILQEQLQLRRIGRDQAEAAPAGHWEMLFHRAQQVLIEERKDLMGEAVASLREGLSADLAPQFGAVIEVRGEDVEFVLDAGGQARQQRRQQLSKRELAVAAKGGRLEANGVEEFRGVKVGCEGAQNFQEFKIPLSLIS